MNEKLEIINEEIKKIFDVHNYKILSKEEQKKAIKERLEGDSNLKFEVLETEREGIYRIVPYNEKIVFNIKIE